MRHAVTVILLLCVFALSGCKVELYSEISQRESNEMLALLLSAGIDADKVVDRDGKTTIRVDESQVERAVAVLMARGLPRSKSLNIMDIFKSEGLIASAGAERMRYIYAMSEELSGTLSQLDGAVAVRVHIAVPEEKRANRGAVQLASAAVFIKYQSQYDFDSYVPLIKQLVANSVEGVEYDRVSVVLFPTEVNLIVPTRTTGAAEESSFAEILSLLRSNLVVVLISFGAMLAVGGLGAYAVVQRGRRSGHMADGNAGRAFSAELAE